MRLGLLVLAGLASACLVQRPPPDAPSVSATRETRQSRFPDGTPRSEWHVLAWPDGRVERDGPEREFHPNGTLRSEGRFAHGVPVGVWRTWFADGRPRSEVDFGTPGSSALTRERFWHPNGALAAEGPAVAGVREGAWSYWSEAGLLLRAGAYRAGRRDGPWVFYGPDGSERARGSYELGVRVGSWTLWDERGEAHVRPAEEVEPDPPERGRGDSTPAVGSPGDSGRPG